MPAAAYKDPMRSAESRTARRHQRANAGCQLPNELTTTGISWNGGGRGFSESALPNFRRQVREPAHPPDFRWERVARTALAPRAVLQAHAQPQKGPGVFGGRFVGHPKGRPPSAKCRQKPPPVFGRPRGVGRRWHRSDGWGAAGRAVGEPPYPPQEADEAGRSIEENRCPAALAGGPPP